MTVGSSPSGAVVVTGALGGMGWACAQRFARAEAPLILTDLDEVRGKESAHALASLGVECSFVASDISDSASIAELVEHTRAKGGLGYLIHTAAVSPSMADWRTLLTIDLLGTAHLLDGMLPLVGPGSAAVCFASIAAHQGFSISKAVQEALDHPLEPHLFSELERAAEGEPTSGMAYIWAKTAIVRLCERMAVPWGELGARVVSLSPGLMDTPMGRYELEHNPRKRPMMAVTPLKRVRAPGQSELPGRTDDIADAVEFLCSEGASFITGCDLRVDGGFIGALRYPSMGESQSVAG